MNRFEIVALGLLTAAPALTSADAADRAMGKPNAPVVEAHSRQLRIDLVWASDSGNSSYEVQRSQDPDGPFEMLESVFPGFPVYSDFIGKPGEVFYYRVRRSRPGKSAGDAAMSDWSAVAEGRTREFNAETLPAEVQEATFRYFYHYGHPTSGLAREATRWHPDACASGASGMGMFNLAVGIERGYITRKQGADRALKILRFLSGKAERFHGAFSHILNGATGAAIPFTRTDDGADLVETAFLMQGVLLLREYFDVDTAVEREIRTLANDLWEAVEWDWFAREEGDRVWLFWHWSPDHGWIKNHPIRGFNECQIVYLLAMASPTHSVPPRYYWQGWRSPYYGVSRTEFGIPLDLGRDLGPPLFWTHYSYLGMDPGKLTYQGVTYQEHFRNLCRVQIRYAESKQRSFEGYGPMWGLTSSYGPDGYRGFAPGRKDNGTIAPTAALSSMPYVPAESQSCLAHMYQHHGRELWGPFGFYDAFNLSRAWVARDYIGIDVGPIAPMIENHRSGFCWKVFMKAPEIQQVLARLNASEPAATEAKRTASRK